MSDENKTSETDENSAETMKVRCSHFHGRPVSVDCFNISVEYRELSDIVGNFYVNWTQITLVGMMVSNTISLLLDYIASTSHLQAFNLLHTGIQAVLCMALGYCKTYRFLSQLKSL